MDREKIFKVAIIVALMGILTLLVISDMVKPEAKRVCGIDGGSEGKLISVKGYAYEISRLSTGGKSFVLYENECRVKVVFFSEDIVLNKGDEVRVVGVVQSYRGELEIVADRIDYS